MELPIVTGVIAGIEEADTEEEGTINYISAPLPQVHHHLLLLHLPQAALGLLLNLDLYREAKKRKRVKAKAKDDDN